MEHGPHRHACGVPGGPQWVGDPVDVITGENVFTKNDFTVPGGVGFQFRRNYNHRWAAQARGIGRGFRHSFDQWLCFDVDGLTYVNAEGGEVRFPFLDHDGERAASGGFTLERERADEYRVLRHAQPTRVFRPAGSQRRWPLSELEKEGERLRLHFDGDRVQAAWIDAYRCVYFVYSEAGQIVEVQLRRTGGDTLTLVRYRYDEHQRLIGGIDPYKQRFGCGYDAQHRLIERIDEAGYRFFFEYDSSNRCIRTHGEDGLLAVQLTYDPGAQQSKVIDANGAEWLYEYDGDKNLVRVVDPYGGATIFERGPGGEVIAEVDPEGRRTEYIRDAAGAQTGKRLPTGIIVPLPEKRGDPDPDEHRVPAIAIEWEYGDLWELDFGLPDQFELLDVPASVRDVLTTSEAPERGRVSEVRDDTGLLIREELEDGRKRRYGYTHRGKVRRLRDFDGGDYKLETRSWDLPWRATDPLGNVTEYEYTQTAELSEVTDPSGNRVHYEYDLKDRLTAIGREGQVHDRYAYDGSDNLIAKYDGRGNLLLEREYDAQARLVRRALASGDEHLFEYDAQGWVTRAKTRLHDTQFEWDGWRRKVRDERNGKGVRHRFAGEDLVRTTLFDRFRTEYHHVGKGTIVVVDPSGGTHRIRRHGRGVFTRDFANGWSEAAQYHPRGLCLAKIAYATDAPERAWARRYHYSGEGDLERVIDTDKGVTQHRHDAAHRLVGTQHPDGRQDGYRYTKSGSLREKPGLSDTTVSKLNQLVYAAGHRFEYGLRQHVVGHTTPDGRTLRLRYDARDQLVAADVDGQPYFTAEYDAIGRRIEKTVRGETTRYYWDGDRLASEVRPDGRLRVYVYPDAFAMVPLLFVDYESEDADPASGTRYYLFCDQRGCPERVIDDLGVVVWEAYVEPYGTAHISVGADFYQPLRFPGHWWDAELGFHYNRFRYYSPWLGRYLQVDPIGEQGGPNVYAYPANPLTHIDIDGLNECGGDGPDPGYRRRRGGGDRPDSGGRAPVRRARQQARTRDQAAGVPNKGSARRAQLDGMVRQARNARQAPPGRAQHNYSIADHGRAPARVSAAESEYIGQRFVGGGAREMNNGVGLVGRPFEGRDGELYRRSYRRPAAKPNSRHTSTGVQSNLETQRLVTVPGRWEGHGNKARWVPPQERWSTVSDGHIDVEG